MEEQAKQVAELLKVLANENRLLILCALLKKEMTVGELGLCVANITQPALSQHLALLKAHQILESEKHGLTITYRIRDKRIRLVIDVLKNCYCEG